MRSGEINSPLRQTPAVSATPRRTGQMGKEKDADFMDWLNNRTNISGKTRAVMSEKHATPFGRDMRRRAWQKKKFRIDGAPSSGWVPPEGGGDPIEPTADRPPEDAGPKKTAADSGSEIF